MTQARVMDMQLMIATFVLTTIAYEICLAIYRISVHPLAGFPGPKLAAATKWWEFYMDNLKGYGGTYAWEIDRMHEKYGPIVRINPNELHIKDPEWFEVLYTGTTSKRNKYAPAAKMVGTPMGTFGTIDHDLHRRRRAAISPFFSKRTIKNLAPTYLKNIRLLCDGLERHMKLGNPLEIRIDYLAYASESVCNSAFGSSLGLLDDYDRATDWKKTMEAVGNITPLAKQFSFVVPVALLLPPGLIGIVSTDLARLLKIHKDMQKRASEAIEKNRAIDLEEERPEEAEEADGNVATMFENILSSALPSKEKQRDRMAQEGFITIVAGSDTISRILTAATFHTLDNAWVYKRLQEELDATLPTTKSEPQLDIVEKLPWLTAVIKEALRIAALLTSRLPLVSPDEDLHYHDWRIPAGTPVSMTLGSILTDPSAFSEPYKFNPERWLDNHPECAKAHKFLVPFNRGTRMCIGMNFAYAEMYLVLATVFRRFELELFETIRDRDVDYKRDCFLGKPGRDSKGIRVKVIKERA